MRNGRLLAEASPQQLMALHSLHVNLCLQLRKASCTPNLSITFSIDSSRLSTVLWVLLQV